MRRYRMRSITIDAENEEDFIQEYDRIKKSKLSQINFNSKVEFDQIKEEGVQDEEIDNEDLGIKFLRKSRTDNKEIKYKLYNEEEEDEYGNLGGSGNVDSEEEDNLGIPKEKNFWRKKRLDEENSNNEEESNEINKSKDENFEEKNIELLCLYLKNSIILEANKDNDNKKITSGNNVFYRNKKNINSLSGNAIYDLNIRELINDIINSNDNVDINTNNETKDTNFLREIISQNIESDCHLKIMVMSNNKSTKKLFIEKLLDRKHENLNNNNVDDNYEEPFEIRKKQIRLFNKNVTLQIFDTSDKFHQNSVSSVYYKSSGAFFILIEATNYNSIQYLNFMFEKIEKFLLNKTIIIFGINMLFEEDYTIDGKNLREYATEKNWMFIPIKLNDFNLENKILINLLNLILIKKIDNNYNYKNNDYIRIRKESKESFNDFNKSINVKDKNKEEMKKLGGIKNKLTSKIVDDIYKNNRRYIYDLTKMKICSSIGYKKRYRIKHINAFDMEDSNEDNEHNYNFDKYSWKKQRKWSVDQ